MKKCIAGLLLLAFAFPSFAETNQVSGKFESEYFMTTSFRCVSEFEGGVQHEKRGHDTGNFRPDLEFRLVHRTALPPKLLEIWENYDEFQPKVSSSDSNLILERNTYFLRRVTDNPNIGMNWRVCFAQRWEKIPTLNNISCSEDLSKVDEVFRFNLVTKKFSYAYLGSWDLPQEKRSYHGDSSVFAYGKCKPYYD